MTAISGLDLIREIMEVGIDMYQAETIETKTNWIDHYKTALNPLSFNMLYGNYALPAVTQIAANAYIKAEMSVGFVVKNASDAKDLMIAISNYIEPECMNKNGYVEFPKMSGDKDVLKFISNQSERPILFEVLDNQSAADAIAALDSQCDIIFCPHDCVKYEELQDKHLSRSVAFFYARYNIADKGIPSLVTNIINVYSDIASGRNVLVAHINKRIPNKESLQSVFLLADGPVSDVEILDFPPYEHSKPQEPQEPQPASDIIDEDVDNNFAENILDSNEVALIKMSMMVKLCRTLLKMSQSEFANFMDISLPTVNRIENLEAGLSVTELFSVMHNLKSFGIAIDLDSIGNTQSDISFTIGGFAVQSYAKGTKVYDNAILRTVREGRYHDLRSARERTSIYPQSERNEFNTSDAQVLLFDKFNLERIVDEVGIDQSLFQELSIAHKPFVAAIGYDELVNSTECSHPLAFVDYAKVYFLPDDEFEELSLAIEGQFEDDLEDMDEETIESIKACNGDTLRFGFDDEYALTLISFVHDLSKDGNLTADDFVQMRKKLGLSLKRFADVLGISHVTLSRLISGDSKPSASVVEKMTELKRANH